MSYTEEEIKKYLDILHNYTSQPIEEFSGKSKFQIAQILNILPLILATKSVMNVGHLTGIY